jgi:hypothetical protein
METAQAPGLVVGLLSPELELNSAKLRTRDGRDPRNRSADWLRPVHGGRQRHCHLCAAGNAQD